MTQILYKRVFPFYISFLVAAGFGLALENLWFLKNDYSYFQIVTFSGVKFLTGALIVSLGQIVKTTNFLRIGVILSMASSFLLVRFLSPVQPYLIAILIGTNMFFLWIPYNIIHFKATNNSQKAFSSGLYFLISPILSVILPALTGIIAAVFGYKFNFLTGFLLFLIPLYLTFNLPHYQVEYKIIDSLRKIPKIISFNLIEGIWETTLFSGIPIFTLYFIQTPKELGFLTAAIAAVATIVNLLFAKISDRIKKRTIFIYPATIILSFATIALGFANSLTSWVIFATIISAIAPIAWTFMIALVIDLYPNPEESMIPREFLLNLGRLIGVVIVVLSLILFKSPRIAFIVLGLALTLFPILLYTKKIYKDVNI